ncbi:MAG: D-tyrosyl-tRNA(Tyr) deacylase [Candidatus Blackburnbacteria bacterium]|nr:D-tyrosyl-tRNA(Tyr) deacylase [Candidatus Blackburnbacteria bacterium]
MRLVIQRVKEARVKVSGDVVGEIANGFFILLGVGQDDKPEYADFLAKKLVKMRIMQDQQGKMNLSVKDVGGKILVVSQFTLYADTSAGNRPSFIKAASPDLARELYERFLEKLKEHGISVSTGSFGEYMEIENIADGPVTIILEYPNGKY